ncbi:hypothetical protein PCASD_09721 [Puccinia coronata f. sp. avenae]|uniref:Uncharacterized protein n=1 Tax=Puccinia coronata f. sp. avenae TaxID=200324 RepID=A0A2N5TF98_9BASI|nr:hypothetical protein PCASD_09721 [Puccinia coronata f. sp. avenae]
MPSSSRSSSSSSSNTVTHFDLPALIEQNNLSQDSCLLVVENKVYDLTLWLQEHCSTTQPGRTEPAVPSETSSSPPSPPPSPTISRSTAASHPNTSNSNSTSNSTSTSILNHHHPVDHPQLNQFDHLLLSAKRDPVQAGHLLRSIYLQQPFRNDGSPLEDWLSEYRIGDFSNSAHTILSEPSSSSSCPTTTITSTTTTTTTSSTDLSHAQYHLRPSSYWHADRHSNRISPSQTQASCVAVVPLPEYRASQARETSTTSAGAASHPDHHHHYHQRTAHPAAAAGSQPSHLQRALDLVELSKQRVIDAQRGVGMANLSLADAFDQLNYAEKVKNHLVHQAAEGYKPIWPAWNPSSSKDS